MSLLLGFCTPNKSQAHTLGRVSGLEETPASILSTGRALTFATSAEKLVRLLAEDAGVRESSIQITIAPSCSNRLVLALWTLSFTAFGFRAQSTVRCKGRVNAGICQHSQNAGREAPHQKPRKGQDLASLDREAIKAKLCLSVSPWSNIFSQKDLARWVKKLREGIIRIVHLGFEGHLAYIHQMKQR